MADIFRLECWSEANVSVSFSMKGYERSWKDFKWLQELEMHMLQSQVLAADVLRPFFNPCPDFRHFQLPGFWGAVSLSRRWNVETWHRLVLPGGVIPEWDRMIGPMTNDDQWWCNVETTSRRAGWIFLSPAMPPAMHSYAIMPQRSDARKANRKSQCALPQGIFGVFQHPSRFHNCDAE